MITTAGVVLVHGGISLLCRGSCVAEPLVRLSAVRSSHATDSDGLCSTYLGLNARSRRFVVGAVGHTLNFTISCYCSR